MRASCASSLIDFGGSIGDCFDFRCGEARDIPGGQLSVIGDLQDLLALLAVAKREISFDRRHSNCKETPDFGSYRLCPLVPQIPGSHLSLAPTGYMRLKVQSPEGQKVVAIDDEATLQDLLHFLRDDGNEAVNIKAGFPPKLVDLENKDVKLLDVGIRAGDKLIVEMLSQSTKTLKEAPSAPQKPTSSTPYAESGDGYCVLRKVPDDNSCLFRAISYAVFKNLEEGSQLRSIVADVIRKEDTYSSAILGKEKSEYVRWIQQPTSWGGGIELQILSKHLGITIKSLDVENQRIDEFNPNCRTFIYVLYTGVHYDTVAYTPLRGIDSKDADTCVFEAGSTLELEFSEAFKRLGASLNHKGYVTNTAKFKIKCNNCGAILDGERSASEHASSTGHYNFGEV